MIFRYLDLLDTSPLLFLTVVGSLVASLVVGISFHEFSHAIAADSLGDPTPRRQGRISLNPARHLDPAGTLMLFLVGFGWGKPVQVNPYAMRNGRTGMTVTALMGPLSNIVVAALAGLPFRLGWVDLRFPAFHDPGGTIGWAASDFAGYFLANLIGVNLVLAVFNLLPVPPLDGFNVLRGVAPPEWNDLVNWLYRYGMGVLFALLVLPFFLNVNPLADIMGPSIEWLARLIGVGDIV